MKIVFILTAIVFYVAVNALLDIWLDYRDIKLEQSLSDERDKFGISETFQDAMIDEFGYPDYLDVIDTGD